MLRTGAKVQFEVGRWRFAWRHAMTGKVNRNAGSRESRNLQDEESVAGLSDEERRRMIAEAAYYRAQTRGFGSEQELDDWLAAEKEVDGRLGPAAAAEPGAGDAGQVRARQPGNSGRTRGTAAGQNRTARGRKSSSRG